MNKFEIEVRELDLKGIDSQRAFAFYSELKADEIPIEIFVRVDEEPFGERGVVDVLALIDGMDGDCDLEKFPLFTCGCGDEGCAGINSPIALLHRENELVWRFDENFAHWAGYSCKSRKDMIELRFKKSQIDAELERLRRAYGAIGRRSTRKARLPLYDGHIRTAIKNTNFVVWLTQGRAAAQ